MPELPEVETIKRGLQTYLVGHTVKEVKILDPLRFTGDPNLLIGKAVIGVERKGKGLVIHFSDFLSLAIHVKMTGQLIYRGKKTENFQLSPKVGVLPNKFTRIIFKLDQNAILYYNDIRRFGWLRVVASSEVETLPFFQSLGPEPFADLTVSHLQRIFSKSRAPIKSVLLDQKKIGGVGNIYANDALYVAKIDPRRAANTLTISEIERLFEAIHEVMSVSIECGAASDTNYVDALGQDGRYQEHFRIYGRSGSICVECGETVERIVVGGRGTFICCGCQM